MQLMKPAFADMLDILARRVAVPYAHCARGPSMRTAVGRDKNVTRDNTRCQCKCFAF